MQAEGFAGIWNITGISISLYSFVPIDSYSVFKSGNQDWVMISQVQYNFDFLQSFMD